MNHYQRLKVSQDAPAEVIRAAYRALATKLHPDRQGADTGPLDALHSEMAALNGAYEILIDPKLRADYDATLSTSGGTSAAGVGAAPSLGKDSGWFGRQTQAGQHADEPEPDAGPQTRVDMDWLTPGAGRAPAPWWRLSGGNLIMAGLGGVALAVALAWGIWNAMSQRQVDDALSRQYRSAPPSQSMVQAADDLRAIAPVRGESARRPSVEELSRMSDEELLRVLPSLDADVPASPSQAALPASKTPFAGHHPLDGTPLSLRNEIGLVDPLAPGPR